MINPTAYIDRDTVRALKESFGLSCAEYNPLEGAFSCEENEDTFQIGDMHAHCGDCERYREAVTKAMRFIEELEA